MDATFGICSVLCLAVSAKVLELRNMAYAHFSGLRPSYGHSGFITSLANEAEPGNGQRRFLIESFTKKESIANRYVRAASSAYRGV